MIDQEVRTPAPRTGGLRASRGRRALTIGFGVFAALIALRLITGETDITSSGTMSATLGLAVPIGMAAMGGLWSERSGVVNIGLEGMMVFGTWGAAFGSYFSGSPWLGLLAGVIAGALGGLLHAVATVTFGVDHIVSGVAINILAPGVTRYLSDLLFTHEAGGGATQSPQLPDFPTWSVPGVGGPLGDLEKHHWFLISDLAGIIGGLVTNLSVITILAVVLFVGSWWLLWRTPFGLRLRSCGENPTAAESLGVNVYKYKYAAVAVSGGLAGLGGAFLALVTSHTYLEGQTGGRGYIGLAAMIFGNWRPGGLAMGAGLFGYSDALQLRNGGTTVHALLLLLVILLVALAGWKLYRTSLWQGAISLIVAALVLLWYLVTDEVPSDFVGATPYVVTLLVLSLSAQRLRMPKADGMRYRKGQGK
jgi:general nucleoside transport system permease protein